MANISPDFTPKQREELFGEIVRLYDFADDIAATVATQGNTNRAKQAVLATPFVTQVTNSANILSAFYTEVVRGGRAVTPELQETMEAALRNIFMALKDFTDGAEETLLPREGAL